MKYAWLGCLLLGSLLFAGTQDSELNVNTRYTVDTVIVAGKGWQTERRRSAERPSQYGFAEGSGGPDRGEAESRHSGRFGTRLKKEFYARRGKHHVLRGNSPDHVQVEFEVTPGSCGIDATVTKFLYDSRQGWSGAGAVGFTVHQNTLPFRPGERRRQTGGALRGNLRRAMKINIGHRSRASALPVRELSRAVEPEHAECVGGAAQPDVGRLPDAAEFRAEVTISLAKPLTLESGSQFSALSEPVSGRAYRVGQRPDHYSALSPAAGGIGKPARCGRRLQLARGHQDSGQRFRLYVACRGIPLPGNARQASADGSRTSRVT